MLKRATVRYFVGPMGLYWGVDLPTTQMIPGTWEPITPGMIDENGVLKGADPKQVLALGPTCVCELPDDTPLDSNGQIDKAALGAMYGGRWANPDWVPPVLSWAPALTSA